MNIVKSIIYFYEYNNYAFIIVNYIAFALYFTVVFVAIFGYTSRAPELLDRVDFYLRVYIGVFLLWSFSSSGIIKCNSLDKQMAFSAGCFIIFITIVNDMVKDYCKILNKRITNKREQDQAKADQAKADQAKAEQTEVQQTNKNIPHEIQDYDPYSRISIGFQ